MSSTFDLTQFLAQNGALGSSILLLYYLFAKPQQQAIDRLENSVYDLRDEMRDILHKSKIDRHVDDPQ